MAHLTCNFFSKSLMRTVDITVILPTDKFVFTDPDFKPQTTFKTLYLLHGIFGSTSDWINGTRIEAWAQEKNLAVGSFNIKSSVPQAINNLGNSSDFKPSTKA